MKIYIQFLISFTNKSNKCCQIKIILLDLFQKYVYFKNWEKYSSDYNFKCVDELILKHF